MAGRLLIEYKRLPYDRNIINEQIQSGSPITLKGIFQEAGTINENGRIYPKEILEREVEKFQNVIQENRAYGSLDHPDSSIIEMSNACVLIKELSWNGNQVMGQLEVLDTTKGRDLKGCLKAGGSVGVSSRAFGSTQRNDAGNEIVNEDLQLITWDCVSSPSVTRAILQESYDLTKKYFYNPKIDRIESIHRLLDKINKEL